MAKTYHFRVVIRRAEFSKGFISVPIGGADNEYATETMECTLAAAIVRRQAMSDAEPRSHYASIMMVSRSDRKPPGFSNVKGLQIDRSKPT
jgi:hypothetical protein